MKSLHTIAISSTLIAFLLSGVAVVHVQEVSMVAQVLESVPQSEKSTITYDFSSGVQPQSLQVFPEIKNAPISFEDGVSSPRCPFVPSVDNVVVDFTRNRTVPLTALYVHADKGAEDAQHTIPVEVGAGVYTVQLASYNKEKEESEESEESYNQRWYLLFYDEAENVIYKSNSTRDMYDGERETVELVEREILLEVPVSEIQARHTAYPDTESHTVAPLCALLSKKTEETTGSEKYIELPSERTLFSASTFLVQDDPVSKEYRVYVALTLMLTLIMALGLFVVSPTSRTDR